jgi:hypothetical protein
VWVTTIVETLGDAGEVDSNLGFERFKFGIANWAATIPIGTVTIESRRPILVPSFRSSRRLTTTHGILPNVGLPHRERSFGPYPDP